MTGPSYAAVLRHPGVPRVITGGILARLPLPMVGIGVVLLARSGSVGLAVGGLVVSVFGLATAMSASLWGRVADRRGARGVLLLTGAAQGAALLALGPALHAGAIPAFVVAALAGGTQPPVSGVVRAQWASLPGQLQTTAQAMEAVVTELVFLLGPLVFGLVVALASPGAGLVTAAAFAVVGSAFLALAPHLRPPLPATGGHLFGVLRLPAVQVLAGVFLLEVLAFAAVEVGVTVSAASADRQALAGPLLAIWALGSVVGGLAWGAVAHRRPLHQQLVVTTVGVVLLLAPLAVTEDPRVLLLLMLPAGLAIAPGSTVIGALVGRGTPPAEHAEAYGLVYTGATALGAAVGYAAAASAADSAGSRAAIAVGVVGAAAAAALASGARRRLPSG